MRRTRVTSLVILAMAFGMLVAAALPAGAAGPAGAIIYRGVAKSPDICYPLARTANPVQNAACVTDTPNNTGTRTWTLDIGLDPLDFCVGANSLGQVGVKSYSGPAAGAACDLKGGGLVKSGPAYEDAGVTSPVRVGPYCGASHGTGNFDSIVGTVSTKDQVEWIQSAATVLPVVDGDVNNTEFDRDTNGDGSLDSADKVLTAGVTDAIGSLAGGNCGLTGPSIGFNVIGVAVAVGQ